MGGFKDRERGEESKFAHDAELTFKATVRRNRLVGRWIAEEFLKIEGEEAIKDFESEVVAADFDKPGDDDVVEYVIGKVQAAGGELTEARLRHRMDELFREALEQVKAQG